MEPVVDPARAGCRLGLGNFIRVMYGDVISAAAF